MKTKLFALCLAGCLICSLCSCGSNSNPVEGDRDGTDSNSASAPAVSENTNTYRTRTATHYGPSGEVYYWIEYTYGDTGDYESVTSYRADGSESGHIDILYDGHGEKLVGYTITGLGRSSRNGELEPPIIKEDTGAVSAIYYEREYDDAGNLIRLKETYEKYENDYVYEYDYNSAGQRINCRTYANYEGGYRNTLYEYDADGNLLSSKEYRLSDDAPDGYLAYERRYEYDSEGREVVNEYYGYLGAEALFVSRTEHEYTDDGHLSRVNNYDANGLSEYTVYEGPDVYELYIVSNGQEILYERVEYTYS